MGFAINPSMNFIDIPEPHVVDFYRSKGEVKLQDARFRGHSSEAYICISRVEKTMKAYVALLETGMKSVFVYTSDFSADTAGDYPKVYQEAEDFTSSLGFTMEKVNLEFSPAMREVIIKGFAVMRAPKKAKVTLRSLNPIPKVEVPPQPLTPQGAKAVVTPQELPDSVPVEIGSLRAELASARAAMEKVAREKITLEQNASREIAALKDAARKAADAARTASEKFTYEIEILKNQIAKGEGSKADKELLERVQSELALQKKSAAQTEASLKNELSSLKAELAGATSEKTDLAARFASEKNALQEKISRLAAEKEAASKLLASERAAASDKIAELSAFESSWKEGQVRAEGLSRDLEQLQKQLDLSAAELEALRGRETREEHLRLRLTEKDKEIVAIKAELERLQRTAPPREAVNGELQALAAAKEEVEAEYIRLANEAIEKESEMHAALQAADMEITRLTRELEMRSRADELAKSALRDELRQLIRSGAIAPAAAEPASTPEQPAYLPAAPMSPPAPAIQTQEPPRYQAQPTIPPEPEASSHTPSRTKLQPEPDVEDVPDDPVTGSPEITANLMNEFGSFSGSSNTMATEFKIDPQLTAIPYADFGEIAAILYSSNTVQAVPDNSKIQRCRAYIIATRKGDEYRAYVAWYLTESDKVVICTPDEQPANAEECTNIILDAVSYFEIVGFMMEVETLGETARSYARAVRKVPALVRV